MTMRIFILISVLLFSNGLRAEENTGALQPADPIGIEKMVLKSLPDPVQTLLQYALSHEGISYHRGGTTPESGFDCSGFVRHVFDHVEGVSLPHSANALSRIGSQIKITELHPGDLVFFRFMRNTISHVGIYLGNNQFIHASSTRSGSVMVSSLTDDYWAKHFALVRRIDSPAEQNSGISKYLPPAPELHLDQALPSLSAH